MTSLPQPQPLATVQDYLDGEQATEVKHEYLAGQIVAMGGASDKHGLIAGSLYATLLPSARRKACQLFMADMKVRVDHDGESYFYYPDLLLSCQPDDRESAYYRRHPCLLVEVLSPSTERIDSREKLLAYRLLPSLREYLLLRQDSLQADLYQRAADGRWQHQRLTAPGDVLTLECLGADVTLSEIYVDLADLSVA